MPSSFDLQFPERDSVIDFDISKENPRNHIGIFSWNNSESSAGKIQYIFRLWNDKELRGDENLVFESELGSPAFISLTPEELPSGSFWWDVVAVDPEGNTTISNQTYQVTISPTNVEIPGFLSGTIHHAFDGSLLRSGRVFVKGVKSSPDFPLITVDSNGSYIAAGIPGAYVMTAVSDGFADSEEKSVMIRSVHEEVVKFALAPADCESKADGIILYSGWNMISLPKLPDHATVGAIFEDANRTTRFVEDSLWRWEAGEFVSMNPVEAVESGTGYWVWSDTGKCIPFRGKTPSTVRQELRKGGI